MPIPPLEDELYRDMLDGFLASSDDIDEDDLQDAIENYDIEHAQETVGLNQAGALFIAILASVLFGVVRDTAATEAAELRMAFNAVDRRFIAWVEDRATNTVTGMTAQAREAVQGILVRGIRAGLSPEQIAFQIKNALWVHDRNNSAIERMRDAMVQNGMKPDVVQQKLDDAIQRALANRARVLAATEVTAAMTQAQLMVWDEAIRRGVISGGRKRWKTAHDERVCPFCRPLDGVTVDLGAHFPGGLIGPPAHPLCRCRMVLVQRGR